MAPMRLEIRAAALALLCFALGAEAQGVRADLPAAHRDLYGNRDLVAATVAESLPQDGRVMLDVTQVFQGTLWRGKHAVAWQPPAEAPRAGTRIIAFAHRAPDGSVVVTSGDAYADTPANRSAVSSTYLRIGKNDYSLEVLSVFALVGVALAAYLGLRVRSAIVARNGRGKGPATS